MFLRELTTPANANRKLPYLLYLQGNEFLNFNPDIAETPSGLQTQVVQGLSPRAQLKPVGEYLLQRICLNHVHIPTKFTS